MNMTNAENACIDESIMPIEYEGMFEQSVWRELSKLKKRIRFAKKPVPDYIALQDKLMNCGRAQAYALQGGVPP